MRATNFLKTKNIIRVAADETLSSALNKMNSSHDAAFVFSDDNHFLGVINPYHSLIKTSFPANAKVEHCVFHPPKIHINTPISKIAQLMIESKLHYLPVFDEKNNFTGIVSARNLLSHFKDSHLFEQKIGDFLVNKNQELLTILEDDLVSHALTQFKTYKVSKLVVINRDMKLRGILSYYDLIQFLVVPKEKTHRGDREGNKVSFTYNRVKNLAKSYVLTLENNGKLKDVLSLIIEKTVGSIVIIDLEKHPIGIITTRDFLTLIANKQSARQIEVVTKNLSKDSTQILSSFFTPIASWIKKIPDLTRATLFVKEEKGGGVFKAVLSLIPRRGKPKVIKTEGKNLKKVLIKIKKD